MLNKEIGIVLECKIFSEADAIITLLGSLGPKARFSIKGIKKSKTRPIVATEIGSKIQVDYYDHKEKEIKSIKEIAIQNRFDRIKSSYNGYMLLTYICELVNSLTAEGDFQPKIFQLMDLALSELDSENFKPLFLPFFKSRLLNILGLMPKEYHCHICHENLESKNIGYIHPYSLEATCGDCLSIEDNHISIIRFLNSIYQNRYASLKTLQIPSSLIIGTDRLINDYIRGGLHLELKTNLKFYNLLDADYGLSI